MKRPYDWRRDCPEDVGRCFPPIIGEGRGKLLAEEDARRKLQGRQLTKETAGT